MTDTTPRKKLIEVALPLEAINVASAREKSIRHGHPSTLHLWWARRPLATCRAVLFASLVDDPCSDPNLSEEQATAKRQELFEIIEDLVKWENSNNPEVLGRARAAIMESTGGNPPPVLDPFCGGGSIPLEAQRLGLEAHGSDLNPVAVLITKALIEIPPKFASRAPVNPESRRGTASGGSWPRATGLAADVRYYGQWMRDEAEKRLGHLYPKAKLPAELGGGEATVVAWIWARTVTCPNPACRARMPLVSSFSLSTKASKKVWVEPVIDHSTQTVRFSVSRGVGKVPDGTVSRTGARCIVCNFPVSFAHVRAEGQARRMGSQLMAVVSEGHRGRVYLPATAENEAVASSAQPREVPETQLPEKALSFRVQVYGMTQHRDLFTPRQLVALTTFSDLVSEARERVRRDAAALGLVDDGVGFDAGGTGATAYAEAVALYLGFAVDKCVDYWSTIATWASTGEFIRGTFARQALPMTWDFAECNPFSASTANWTGNVEWVSRVLKDVPATGMGAAKQADVTSVVDRPLHPLISTDPPYYDNIGYADLSDFFYVWLRRSVGSTFPRLFGTLLVPKAEELVATPYRFEGSRNRAQQFFEQGLGRAFARMRETHAPNYPLSVFYAFKQAESDGDFADGSGVVAASTGWETMLEGLLQAGFEIRGTWPVRTERGARSVGIGTNALASSIVLVCRPRPADARFATRSEFTRALKRELPGALRMLQQGNIAPVDLAQAAIGPGMAVYSGYSKVLEPNGEPLRVRAALGLINQALDDVLAEQDAEYDPDTRWAVAWFEQHGLTDGPYGDAETLSKAKNSSVAGLQEAGILTARAGKVALLRRDQLPEEWDPRTDRRPTVWEVTQHLIRALDQEGESGAARLLARAGGRGEIAKDLAYRLYVVSERKGRAQEALAYNSLVVAWPSIAAKAAEQPAEAQQGRLV